MNINGFIQPTTKIEFEMKVAIEVLNHDIYEFARMGVTEDQGCDCQWCDNYFAQTRLGKKFCEILATLLNERFQNARFNIEIEDLWFVFGDKNSFAKLVIKWKISIEKHFSVVENQLLKSDLNEEIMLEFAKQYERQTTFCCEI